MSMARSICTQLPRRHGSASQDRWCTYLCPPMVATFGVSIGMARSGTGTVSMAIGSEFAVVA